MFTYLFTRTVSNIYFITICTIYLAALTKASPFIKVLILVGTFYCSTAIASAIRISSPDIETVNLFAVTALNTLTLTGTPIVRRERSKTIKAR